MEQFGQPSQYPLDKQGVLHLRRAYWNLPVALLVEEVIARHEGELSPDGAVMVNTGEHTGRSPNDKYVAQYKLDSESIIWIWPV